MAEIFDFNEVPKAQRTGGGGRRSEELTTLMSLEVGKGVRFSLTEDGREGETFKQFAARISNRAYDAAGEGTRIRVRRDEASGVVSCYRVAEPE